MHCENKKGLLVVLSAPSGCGKDTVFRAMWLSLFLPPPGRPDPAKWTA